MRSAIAPTWSPTGIRMCLKGAQFSALRRMNALSALSTLAASPAPLRNGHALKYPSYIPTIPDLGKDRHQPPLREPEGARQAGDADGRRLEERRVGNECNDMCRVNKLHNI